MAKRVRVVTSRDVAPTRSIVATEVNPQVPRLTDNEVKARRLYMASTTMGFGRRSASTDLESLNNLSRLPMAGGMMRTADTLDSGTAQFYSPQLSTDFLEKPQNLRERRAFYRFFYNTNEIVGQAIDIHSTLPLSKLRLVPPKGKNKHQNEYVYKFFMKMCDQMKLFKTLLEITHEFTLFGNCLHKDAEVRAVTGYKKAEDVQVGDLLLTDKGRYRRVTYRFVRPAETVQRISCWKDFRDLPITEEHPVEILRDGEFVFVKAEEISLADYIRVTWPTDVEDAKSVTLCYPDCYKKTEKGYERSINITRSRMVSGLEYRKKLVQWLSSLQEPVIKAYKDLSAELNIPIRSLQSIVFNITSEISTKFHERLGPAGWQKGSQVKWYPLDKEVICISDDYTIITTKQISGIDTFEINDDFAYLVGYWLGDGTLARDSSRDTWGRGLWQISAEQGCFENIARVKKILVNIFGEGSIVEWDNNGQHYLKIKSNPAFIEWWAENFGETSLGKNNKRIPEWFIKLPADKLLHSLGGIIDSDGCISGSGTQEHHIATVAMVSRAIMDPIRDIALKCGIICGYRKGKEREVTLPSGESGMSKNMYAISVSDEVSCWELMKYSNKKIPANAHFSEMKKYWIRTEEGLAFKVRSIDTETYNDLVYNFEVEEDHTFQVAGFSTHNCFVFAEESDWKEDLTSEQIAQKKNKALQQTEFLKQKYEIVDEEPLFQGWKKLLVLPPDQVRVRKLPLTDDVAIEYMPDPETRRFLTSDIPVDPTDPTKKMKYTISQELREKVRQSGMIPLDTDPYTGSHVYHLARKKSQYEPLGVSIIERCINTLVLMDKLRQAQTSIASRHMTPMRIVWAEGMNQGDVDNLREQVDMALVDPDYSIIANYEIHWEEMGSSGRLLDVSAEDESSLNRLFAGLGITREILTGEGTYTGSRISLEIMNTQYMLFREVIQDYVENYLFKPIAKKKGFIEYDEYGNEILLYPRLSFTRLAIRDNEQFFDAAFQLYQKGSISIDLILDILNIDPDSTKEKIEHDLFTVNDSIFNEVMRNIYTNVAAPLVEKTNLVNKLAEYLKLDIVQAAAPAEGASRFSSVQESDPVDSERKTKLSKLLKYFNDNPQALDKVFPGEKK